jgi:hypothetical protein
MGVGRRTLQPPHFTLLALLEGSICKKERKKDVDWMSGSGGSSGLRQNFLLWLSKKKLPQIVFFF